MSYKDGTPTVPKRCKGCIYRDTNGDRSCDYFIITGNQRGCLAEECAHYQPAYTGSRKRAQRAAMRKRGVSIK